MNRSCGAASAGTAMLRNQPIQHFTNDLDKRWTVDDFFDLVVWYEPTGEMHGFQLCYDRFGRHRALTWRSKYGFHHAKVDDAGCGGLGAGMSPVLKPCDDFPWEVVLREFMTRSWQLDPETRLFIRDHILDYGPKHEAALK